MLTGEPSMKNASRTGWLAYSELQQIGGAMERQVKTRRSRSEQGFPAGRTALVLLGAALLALALPLLSGCGRGAVRSPFAPIRPISPIAAKIVAGAKAEVQRGVAYDASYRVISYPGGDVRADRGACTDVVIRALRHAGFDLQRLIHEDMRRHFHEYPQRYGAVGPDASIDHRRVPNQITFFRRHGLELPRSTSGAAGATWQPGDIVYWRLPNGPLHCGVLSDTCDDGGLPFVIHNLEVAREEDCLTAWKIVGHFRYPVDRRTGSESQNAKGHRARAGNGVEKEEPRRTGRET